MAEKLIERPLQIDSAEELETMLLGMWPSGFVERDDLFSRLGITMPLERNIVIGGLGVWTNRYCVADVAALFWSRSNYAEDTDSTAYPGPAQPSQSASAGHRPGRAAQDSPGGGVRHQTGALARHHPDGQLQRLAARMAEALAGIIDDAIQCSGDPNASADLQALQVEYSTWKASRDWLT